MVEHILVPLDGSSLAECVLPHVVALAQAFGARVTLLQVLGGQGPPDQVSSVDPLDWHLRRAEAESYLQEVAALLQGAAVTTDVVVDEGQAAERIIGHIHDQAVDLLILSSHGRGGLSEWNISSVVQKVILRAFRPTLIVRAYQPYNGQITDLRYRRLLVPLDGSHRAESVLPMATTLARAHEAQLLLTHVVIRPEVPRHTPLTREEAELVERLIETNREEAQRYLDDLLPRLSADAAAHLLVRDNPAVALHDLVDREQVDLVVLSAHGYSGDTQWPYGSVALNIIVFGATPLLIVQDIPEEEIEPTGAQRASREHRGH